MEPATQVLAYAATFIAGSLVGAVTTVATFRGQLAALQTATQAHAQQLGGLDRDTKETARDLNGVATKAREDLGRACAELRAEWRDRARA